MAEEQKQSSKKRRAKTANDLHPTVGLGMFTRSKSQIYLHHRNRSGRARFDTLPQPLSQKRRRRLPKEDSSNNTNDELSCILIKDLRTRRVFSNGFGLASPTPTENESEKGIRKIESAFAIKSCSEPKRYEVGVVSNGSDGLVEECVQSTPPDIDLLIDTKVVEENGNPNVGFVMEKQADEINQKNSRIKSFLRPCSRVRLFKAPGSFGYRRLLPYLMDISEENSLLVGGQKRALAQKSGKGLEGKALSTSHGQKIGSTKSNYLDSGNQLNTTSIEESPKEPCKGRQLSHASISKVDECSKPIVNGGIEKFNIDNNSVNDSSGDLNTGKTEDIDVGNPEIMNNLNCRESLVLEENCNYGKDNQDVQCFEAAKPSETRVVNKSEVGGSLEVSTLNHANSNLSDGEQNEKSSNVQGTDGDDGEVLDNIDNSDKEYAPKTPPDDDIFVKPEVAENGGDSMKCMDNADDIPGRPLIGSSHGANNSVNDKTISSCSRRKLVMNRCSRLKLFRTPGSVSYRRMLPFLINIEEDNSCASGKGHVLKLEKRLEASPPSPPLVSDRQEIPLGSTKGNNCHMKHHTHCSQYLPISAVDASSNDQETNSKLFKHVNESPNPLNKLQEQDVRFDQDISDKGRKLDGGPEIMDINHESNLLGLCLHSSSGSYSRKDDKQLSSPASSASTEEDCNNPATEVTNDSKPIEAYSLHQESSLRATAFCLNIPDPVLRKGILKRTPRGCRGLCTCLNCSSFRLHAEKAFDFSRNQMQDAEEVASDLIKELSYMRNVLEKSPFNADGHALVCASQVKEACRRASEAEELAQNRLSEMNFDLNIHCRLTCTQRPRVRFANYVEEKVITKSDMPSKYCLIRRDEEEK